MSLRIKTCWMAPWATPSHSTSNSAFLARSILAFRLFALLFRSPNAQIGGTAFQTSLLTCFSVKFVSAHVINDKFL
jgi:hypothetical protein